MDFDERAPKGITYQYPRAANTSSVIAFTTGSGGVQILGIVRGDEPFKGMLALPGGFHNENEETLEECAARELLEETGIEVQPSECKLVCVQSKPTRDPRAHIIDHVYSVSLPFTIMATAKAGDDASAIKIVDTRDHSLQWSFDHFDSIQRFLHLHR